VERRQSYTAGVYLAVHQPDNAHFARRGSAS